MSPGRTEIEDVPVVDEKELWSRGLRSVSSLMLLRWSVVQNASEIDGPTIGLN